MKFLIAALLVFLPMLSLADDACPSAADASAGTFTRAQEVGGKYDLYGTFDPYHNGNLYLINVPYVNADTPSQALDIGNAALANAKVILKTPNMTCYNGNEGGFCECIYQIQINNNVEYRNYRMEADILD